MEKAAEEVPDQRHRMLALLQHIEWAAQVVNPKTKFRTDTCPACGGIQPGTYGEFNTGHKAGCELSGLLAELRT